MMDDNMTLPELMQMLQVARYPARWADLYDAAMAEYRLRGCRLVDELELLAINDQYHLFNVHSATILRAAALIRANDRLCRFLMILSAAMADRILIKADIGNLDLPPAPPGVDSLGYDLLAFFVFPPTAQATCDSYRAHQVPETMIAQMLRIYEGCIDGFQLRNGRPGFNLSYLNWGQLVVDARLLRIRRFNFELKSEFTGRIIVFQDQTGARQTLVQNIMLHRSGFALGSPGLTDEAGAYDADLVETADYWEGFPVIAGGRAASARVRLDKQNWLPVLRQGDPVISVHIPAKDSLAPEICEQSYTEADGLIKTWYPEFKFKAYVCHSWMMDPQLEDLLPAQSNLVAFQKKYTRFPSVSSGRGVFSFVFLKPCARLEDLPENTTLERQLKKHYLEGRYIYEPGGFFFMPD